MVEVKLFKASWCGQCHVMEDFIKKSEERYPNVKFSYHDVDKEESLITEYDIMNLPTTVILKDGKVERTIHGLETREFITGLDTII